MQCGETPPTLKASMPNDIRPIQSNQRRLRSWWELTSFSEALMINEAGDFQGNKLKMPKGRFHAITASLTAD